MLVLFAAVIVGANEADKEPARCDSTAQKSDCESELNAAGRRLCDQWIHRQGYYVVLLRTSEPAHHQAGALDRRRVHNQTRYVQTVGSLHCSRHLFALYGQPSSC